MCLRLAPLVRAVYIVNSSKRLIFRLVFVSISTCALYKFEVLGVGGKCDSLLLRISLLLLCFPVLFFLILRLF